MNTQFPIISKFVHISLLVRPELLLCMQICLHTSNKIVLMCTIYENRNRISCLLVVRLKKIIIFGGTFCHFLLPKGYLALSVLLLNCRKSATFSNNKRKRRKKRTPIKNTPFTFCPYTLAMKAETGNIKLSIRQLLI